MEHDQYEEERQHEAEHEYHMNMEGEAMAQNEQDIFEAYQAGLKRIKVLEGALEEIQGYLLEAIKPWDIGHDTVFVICEKYLKKED